MASSGAGGTPQQVWPKMANIRPEGGGDSNVVGGALGAVLLTSLTTANKGDRQWRVTERKVKERNRPNVSIPDQLYNLPWQREADELCDAASKLSRSLPFIGCMPQEAVVELLRWADVQCYQEGEVVAAPTEGEAKPTTERVQIILTGSTIAVGVSSGRGDEQSTSVVSSVLNLFSNKGGGKGGQATAASASGAGKPPTAATAEASEPPVAVASRRASREEWDGGFGGTVRYLLEGACVCEVDRLAEGVVVSETVTALEAVMVLRVEYKYWLHAFHTVTPAVNGMRDCRATIRQWLNQAGPNLPGLSSSSSLNKRSASTSGVIVTGKVDPRGSSDTATFRRRQNESYFEFKELLATEMNVTLEAHHLDLAAVSQADPVQRISIAHCINTLSRLEKLLKCCPGQRTATEVAEITACLRVALWPFSPVGLLLGARPARLAAVARRATIQYFEPGEVLHREGEPADFLYALLSGSVKVSCAGVSRAEQRRREARAANGWKVLKLDVTVATKFGLSRRRKTTSQLPTPGSAGKRPHGSGLQLSRRRLTIATTPSSDGSHRSGSAGPGGRGSPHTQRRGFRLPMEAPLEFWRQVAKSDEMKEYVKKEKMKEARRRKSKALMAHKRMSFYQPQEEDAVQKSGGSLVASRPGLRERARQKLAEERKSAAAELEAEDTKESLEKDTPGARVAVVGPGERGLRLLGEEALVPPGLRDYDDEGDEEEGADEADDDEDSPLRRQSTVTAHERCSVMVLDTVGWAAAGGLDATLAAPPPFELSPWQGFWLRLLACNAPDCRGSRVTNSNTPSPPPRPPANGNAWAALVAEGGEQEVDADAVVSSLMAGTACEAAADALRAVPTLLGYIAAPLRAVLLGKMNYHFVPADSTLTDLNATTAEKPKRIGFVLSGAVELVVGDSPVSDSSPRGNRASFAGLPSPGSPQGLLHRSSKQLGAGSVLDAAHALAEQSARYAALMRSQSGTGMGAKDSAQPHFHAHMKTVAACEIVTFPFEAYTLACKLSRPLLGLTSEKAKRARYVLYIPPAERSPSQIDLLAEVLRSCPLFAAMRPSALAAIAMHLTHRIALTGGQNVGQLMGQKPQRPEVILAQVADAELEEKVEKGVARLSTAPSMEMVASEKGSDGLYGNAFGLVLNGSVTEMRKTRQAGADGEGMATVVRGPRSMICDVGSLVMEWEAQPVMAWAEAYSEVAVMRGYDYRSLRAIREDHRAFLGRLVHFIADCSPVFQALEEEDLLGIVPFIEHQVRPKHSIVVEKGATLSHLLINHKGTTTTQGSLQEDTPGAACIAIASHSKNTVLGRASIFLDIPERYSEVVTSSTAELLAVPRSVIVGIPSSKFLSMMRKEAEDELKFYSKEMQQKAAVLKTLAEGPMKVKVGALMGSGGGKARTGKKREDEQQRGVESWMVDSMKEKDDEEADALSRAAMSRSMPVAMSRRSSLNDQQASGVVGSGAASSALRKSEPKMLLRRMGSNPTAMYAAAQGNANSEALRVMRSSNSEVATTASGRPNLALLMATSPEGNKRSGGVQMDRIHPFGGADNISSDGRMQQPRMPPSQPTVGDSRRQLSVEVSSTADAESSRDNALEAPEESESPTRANMANRNASTAVMSAAKGRFAGGVSVSVDDSSAGSVLGGSTAVSTMSTDGMKLSVRFRGGEHGGSGPTTAWQHGWSRSNSRSGVGVVRDSSRAASEWGSWVGGTKHSFQPGTMEQLGEKRPTIPTPRPGGATAAPPAAASPSSLTRRRSTAALDGRPRSDTHAIPSSKQSVDEALAVVMRPGFSQSGTGKLLSKAFGGDIELSRRTATESSAILKATRSASARKLIANMGLTPTRRPTGTPHSTKGPTPLGRDATKSEAAAMSSLPGSSDATDEAEQMSSEWTKVTMKRQPSRRNFEQPDGVPGASTLPVYGTLAARLGKSARRRIFDPLEGPRLDVRTVRSDSPSGVGGRPDGNSSTLALSSPSAFWKERGGEERPHTAMGALSRSGPQHGKPVRSAVRSARREGPRVMSELELRRLPWRNDVAAPEEEELLSRAVGAETCERSWMMGGGEEGAINIVVPCSPRSIPSRGAERGSMGKNDRARHRWGNAKLAERYNAYISDTASDEGSSDEESRQRRSPRRPRPSRPITAMRIPIPDAFVPVRGCTPPISTDRSSRVSREAGRTYR